MAMRLPTPRSALRAPQRRPSDSTRLQRGRSSRPKRLRNLVLVLSIVATACTGGAAEPTPAPVADPLLERAEHEGSVVVIVDLVVPRGSASSFDATRIRNAQRHLMSELGPGARIVERFERRAPRIMLRVTPEALQELRGSARVANITLSETD